MPIDRLVVNASPLIVLFRADLAGILPALCSQVLVPDQVWQEVIEGGHVDRAADGLAKAGWAWRLPPEAIEPVVQAWGLGAGESAVLSHVHANRDLVGVLDDAAARRCARALSLRVIGTGGLLVMAKRAGVIASLAEALKAIKHAGLWITPEIEHLLLQAANEKAA